MMKDFLSTCLLLVLLSPVTSLTCSKCHQHDISCRGDTNSTCKSNEICFSGVLHNNIVQLYQKATFRGCERSIFCHSGDYSFTSANGKFLQMKVFCCGRAMCNKEPPHFPPHEDLSPNGMQCPACLSLVKIRSPQNCQNQGNVSCLANETKCIDYSSMLVYSGFSAYDLKFQGCATDDWCALDGNHFNYGYIALLNIKAKCYNAEKSSRQIDLTE